jgi:hypothetical protein
VQGVLLEKSPDTIVLGLPGTDYKLHLAVDDAGAAHLPELGKPLTGRISARAKRVDKVRSGGRYIEPIMGRPRRIQGRISAIDAHAMTITVWCGCPFTCVLTMNQKAADFAVGDLVSFDVERGARFEPI